MRASNNKNARKEIIEELLHRVEILKVLKIGDLYEVTLLDHSQEPFLEQGAVIRLRDFGNRGIECIVIAIASKDFSYYSGTWYYSLIKSIKRISWKDLPLYVAWKKSELYTEILKGESDVVSA